jgi:hypothetical protein
MDDEVHKSGSHTTLSSDYTLPSHVHAPPAGPPRLSQWCRPPRGTGRATGARCAASWRAPGEGVGWAAVIEMGSSYCHRRLHMVRSDQQPGLCLRCCAPTAHQYCITAHHGQVLVRGRCLRHVPHHDLCTYWNWQSCQYKEEPNEHLFPTHTPRPMPSWPLLSQCGPAHAQPWT